MIATLLVSAFLVGAISGFVVCVFLHTPLVMRVEEAETMMRKGRAQLSDLRNDIARLQEMVGVLDTQSRSEPFPKFFPILDGVSDERSRRDVPDHRNPFSA